jgi:hypothetical protein
VCRVAMVMQGIHETRQDRARPVRCDDVENAVALQIRKAGSLTVSGYQIPADEPPARRAIPVEVNAAFRRDVDVTVVVDVTDHDVVRRMTGIEGRRFPWTPVRIRALGTVSRVVKNVRYPVETADDDVGCSIAVEIGRLCVFSAATASVAADELRSPAATVKGKAFHADLGAHHRSGSVGIDDDFGLAPVVQRLAVDDDRLKGYGAFERCVHESKGMRRDRIRIVLEVLALMNLISAIRLPCAESKDENRDTRDDPLKLHRQFLPAKRGLLGRLLRENGDRSAPACLVGSGSDQRPQRVMPSGYCGSSALVTIVRRSNAAYLRSFSAVSRFRPSAMTMICLPTEACWAGPSSEYQRVLR